MAYLAPKKLHCPNCDFTTEVNIVVGVGPHSKQGDTPYRKHLRSNTGVDGPDLICPNDGTILWTDTARKSV